MSKDQNDLSAAFTRNMEVSEEETRQHLACLGNIAHRYPISFAHGFVGYVKAGLLAALDYTLPGWGKSLRD